MALSEAGRKVGNLLGIARAPRPRDGGDVVRRELRRSAVSVATPWQRRDLADVETRVRDALDDAALVEVAAEVRGCGWRDAAAMV